jgi:hypothetical protein
MLLQYEGPQPPTQGRVFRIPSWGSSTNSSQTSHSIRSRASTINHQDVEAGVSGTAEAGVSPSSAHLVVENVASSDPEKGAFVNGLPPRHVEEPKLSSYFALGLLVVVTVLTVSPLLFSLSSVFSE